jgi:glutathione S-transferase
MHDTDFATAFRPRFLQVPPEQWLAEINKAPLKRRAEYKRSVIEHGLSSEFVLDAVTQHKKLISWMAEDLKRGGFLAGNAFTNADCAVIRYILRLELLKLDAMWEAKPALADWWTRMRSRPSVKPRFSSAWKNPTGRPSKMPWPRVKVLLKAAE